MHSTHGSLSAASVARLAPVGLAGLLVAALISPGPSPGGVPTGASPRVSTVACVERARPTPLVLPSPDWSQTSAASTPKAVAGAPLIASSTIIATGIPATALDAYRRAATVAAVRTPACGISWALLAGIGRMESDHGRFGGAVLYSTGVSSRPIIGPALNGNGTALIRDTDHGYYDHDTVYDHAVGPMQFIPSTWARWGADGNSDGHRDPFNVYDAAGAAAGYLCAAGGDLRTVAGQTRAVFAYNHVPSYVAAVLALEAAYAAGRSGAVIPAVAPPAVSAPAPAPSPPAARPVAEPSSSPLLAVVEPVRLADAVGQRIRQQPDPHAERVAQRLADARHRARRPVRRPARRRRRRAARPARRRAAASSRYRRGRRIDRAARPARSPAGRSRTVPSRPGRQVAGLRPAPRPRRPARRVGRRSCRRRG